LISVLILEETDDIIDHVETFDLEIDDETHSFIANNVIVHNSACTTAFMTGFGSRNCQGSTVYECAQRANIPIIADGGIVYPADIAKAVVLGATMVMCGSLVSGCTDSPGELKFINNEYIKEYWGSASQHESGKSNRIEGTMKLIPYKNKTILEQMHFLKECLQSAISYGGGNTLEALSYVQWK
jgi:GMP reductase